MVVVLFLVAICELIFGFGTWGVAKSAIHEILAALMIGFSFMTFALAAILEQLKRNNAPSEIRIER